MAERKKSAVEHPPTLLGGTAIKPVERHGFEAIRYLIYNPDTGEVFTRTPKSWFLITLFYCVYYSCLAAFWYGMLTLFLSFIPEENPRYMLGSSIIGANPGLGVRPGQADINLDSSMFRVTFEAWDETAANDPLDGTKNIDFANRLDQFLEPYSNQSGDNFVDCPGGVIPDEAYDNLSQKDDKYDPDVIVKRKACRFDVRENLGQVCSEKPYGFEVNGGPVQPCLVLKVNNIYNWKPVPYTTSDQDMDELEELGAPDRIKELISQDPNRVYVHCEGENPADREALEGVIEYFPKSQSFGPEYFPFTQKQEDYRSPLIAIQFKNNVEKGRLYHVMCKLWHKGVVHDLRDRAGLVHFEFLMEMTEEDRKKQKEKQEKEGYNA